MTKEFLTVEQLMERWNLSRSTIKNHAKDSIIPSFRPSARKILFPVEGVVEYEERHTRKEKKKPKGKVLSFKTPKKDWRIE